MGAAVGVDDVGADGEAAGVGVLDHRRRGIVEVADQAAGGIDVEPVGEGQCRSLQLAGVGQAARRSGNRVQRPALMRVLAVAQLLQPRAAHGETLRHRLLGPQLAGQVGGDGGVVGGDVGEGLGGEAAAGRVAHRALGAELGEHLAVLSRRDHHGHGVGVLGGGADHGGTADVDVLHRLLIRGAARHRLEEGIEGDGDDVDRGKAVLAQLRQVIGNVPAGEDARVHRGMQGLHPTVEHLGEAGEVGNREGLDAGGGQRPPGSVGGDELHPGVAQSLRELDQPGLVVRPQQRPQRHRPLSSRATGLSTGAAPPASV